MHRLLVPRQCLSLHCMDFVSRYSRASIVLTKNMKFVMIALDSSWISTFWYLHELLRDISFKNDDFGDYISNR